MAPAISEKATAVAEKLKTKTNFLKEQYARLIRLIHARDFLAECLATFILVTVGDGAVAQFIFSRGSLTFLSVNAGYAIGLMIGAYMAGGVTGGHMNPAVTLAMAVRGKTKWIKVIPYWIAQMLGAFIGSAVVYGAYVDLINNLDGRQSNGNFNPYCLTNGTVTPKLPLCTGGIFATYPNPALQTGSAFFNELLGTFILTIGIFGIIDSGNSEVMSGLKPFMVGLTFWGVGTSFGITTGYALNPARDLAPRIFTAIAGWGKDVFVCSQCSIAHYWWIPITAPMFGAVMAAVFYWFMVEANHPSDKTYDVSGKKETDTEELTEAAA